MKKNAHKNHIRKELIFFIMLALVAGSFPLPVHADSVYVTAGAAAVMDPVNDDAEDEAQNYTIPEELPKGMITVEIDSPSDLIDLAKNATMDSYTKGKCFVLTRDINMIGSYRFDTIPIFSGYFDGRTAALPKQSVIRDSNSEASNVGHPPPLSGDMISSPSITG